MRRLLPRASRGLKQKTPRGCAQGEGGPAAHPGAQPSPPGPGAVTTGEPGRGHRAAWAPRTVTRRRREDFGESFYRRAPQPGAPEGLCPVLGRGGHRSWRQAGAPSLLRAQPTSGHSLEHLPLSLRAGGQHSLPAAWKPGFSVKRAHFPRPVLEGAFREDAQHVAFVGTQVCMASLLLRV